MDFNEAHKYFKGTGVNAFSHKNFTSVARNDALKDHIASLDRLGPITRKAQLRVDGDAIFIQIDLVRY